MRYFFHTADGAKHWDQVGTELASEADARRRAIEFMGEILIDEPYLLAPDRPFRVEVRDSSGQLKFRVIATVETA